MSLRARLVLLALVAAAPTLVVALALERLVSARLEQSAEARLVAAQAAALGQFQRLRDRLHTQLEAVALQDLRELKRSPPDPAALAAQLAQRRDLPLLELLDARGRIVSSAHWPVGLGLFDRDRPFRGDESLRIERVADDYGDAEKLALSASRQVEWQGQELTLRGGVFLDAALLGELQALMQVELLLLDRRDARLLSRAQSPLGAWTGPAAGERLSGNTQVGGAAWRWRARALADELWLIVAVPRAEGDLLVAQVRRTTLAAAALALLCGLSVALLLAGHIARPVSELARRARRVSDGDLESAVPDAGPGEVGELARAFAAMTEALRTSRARLLQAERVASWREMARRLAHELKNPIFPIQLSVETLRRRLERRAAGEPADPQEPPFEQLFHESSDTILEALKSLRKIVDEFSDFARMPQPELRPTDLNAIVQQVLSLYRARAEQVVIEAELQPDLPRASADPALLARALGNLVANALEAMPAGGRLLVRTRAADGALAIEVTDSGPGLDADQRLRLFTPYFTTKRGGTGLGLAIVQGIVSDHGGRIEVESEPGQGTSFRLVLPLVKPGAAASQPPDPPAFSRE